MPKTKKRNMPIIGKIYLKIFKNQEHKMIVIDNNGKLGFKVNNTIYNSPSGAAKAITNQEVNGWEFWKMDK